MRPAAFVVAALGLLVAPVVATAQPVERSYRMGFLSPLFSRAEEDPVLGSLRQGLQALGYTEGKTIAIESRFAEGEVERLPALAAELVSRKVDVIVAVAAPAIHAAKNATGTIPIVMAFSGDDPVRSGFVVSLARPGGNITGLTILAPDLSRKRLALIKEILPAADRVAVLANPGTQTSREQLESIRVTARALALEPQAVEARSRSQLDHAFTTIAKARPAALLVLSDPLFYAHRQRIVDFARESRLPMVSDWKEVAEIGGLVAYGPSRTALAGRAAAYVDKILKGARPADLPVEQPTAFELTVNLNTARILGLTILRSVLVRADQVIE